MLHLPTTIVRHNSMIYLRCRIGSWSRTGLLAVVGLAAALSGCSEGLHMTQSTDTGGVVIYPFKERGALLSPFRKEALQMMEQHCGGPYRILREGETKGRTRINENVSGMEEIRERRWGIEFECKEKK
jgi:hypothetical protein